MRDRLVPDRMVYAVHVTVREADGATSQVHVVAPGTWSITAPGAAEQERRVMEGLREIIRIEMADVEVLRVDEVRCLVAEVRL